MTKAGNALWRLNQEYGQRLHSARNCVALLGQLLLARADDDLDDLRLLEQAFAAFGETLITFQNEHRAWRYRYFYESADERRIVQDDDSILRALAQFARLRARQSRVLADLRLTFAAIPRPDTAYTLVPNGDLWALTAQALADFARLDADEFAL